MDEAPHRKLMARRCLRSEGPSRARRWPGRRESAKLSFGRRHYPAVQTDHLRIVFPSDALHDIQSDGFGASIRPQFSKHGCRRRHRTFRLPRGSTIHQAVNRASASGDRPSAYGSSRARWCAALLIGGRNVWRSGSLEAKEIRPDPGSAQRGQALGGRREDGYILPPSSPTLRQHGNFIAATVMGVAVGCHAIGAGSTSVRMRPATTNTRNFSGPFAPPSHPRSPVYGELGAHGRRATRTTRHREAPERRGQDLGVGDGRCKQPGSACRCSSASFRCSNPISMLSSRGSGIWPRIRARDRRDNERLE
jgi:hypothetical protein